MSKPTFYQLRSLHGGNVLEIARVSGVHPLTVWAMLVGKEVEVIEAHMILCGYNDLCKTHYTLNDIEVVYVRKHGGNVSHEPEHLKP